ncbi:MAG: DUF2336 domain-containing protein [Rhodospirillales bacterium]|nr:DUF2336 domain-containing protein [Rhodospirillales bacterium]MBO6787930.1 DUF2336 domain-containing protein [Rhodospirillales bacterium]
MTGILGEGAISYQKAKELAQSDDPAVRAALAERKDLSPELLYFLAEDASADVRRAVAVNESAPRQTDILLAHDDDENVRGSLAQKIAQVAPGLSQEASEKVRVQTHQALEMLANDQISKVRAILSEALKDVVDAPPDIIKRLANDIEIEVSGPVLEFSPVLTEQDLVEIIEAGPAVGGVAAIARRDGVTESLADAIIGSDDVEGIADLLGNNSAQIREEALDDLIDRSASQELWQPPLVARKQLPEGAAQRMAGFIAENLLEELSKRADFDAPTMAAVKDIVRDRLGGEGGHDKKSLNAGFDFLKVDPPLDTAKRLNAAGKLHDKVVVKALQAGDHAFVFAAMIERAGVDLALARKIFVEKNPAGIVALLGRARMPASMVIMVQQQMGRIAPSEIIEPEDDTTFPMSQDDIDWNIEFFSNMAERA